MVLSTRLTSVVRCLLFSTLCMGAGLVHAKCKDDLVLVNGAETTCMADIPGLLDIKSGQMSLGDTAFSHASLVVSAAGPQCGGVVGFAWGAGTSTPSKSINYCERHLQNKLGKHDVQRLGCTCEVFLIPDGDKGRFRLLKPQLEFLSALQLSSTTVASNSPKPTAVPAATLPTSVVQTTTALSPPPIVEQRPTPSTATPLAQTVPVPTQPPPATFGGDHHDQGTFTFAGVNKYVGDYKDGKRNGQGIEYASNGSITRQGRWENNSLVQSFAVDVQRFPFNAPIQTAQSGSADTDRMNAEAQVARQRQQELELRLAVQTAEAEAAKRRQQELEAQNKVLQANQQNRDSDERLKNSQRQNQLAVTSPMATMANRRALVIGNDTYKSVPKLVNAREDAKTIATNLTSVGYQVTLKLDVTEKEMKAALRTFAGQVQGGDEVLFFFAGHGVQLGATNFLLPIDIVGDSEAQVKDEAIQLQRVLDDMSEKKAKFTLAMVDACRDNPFKNTGRAIGGRGLAATTTATGQMVIFSAGSGQQALDKLNNSDKNKNGLFTRVFAQEMQNSNQSVNQIIRNVRNQVAELAKSVGKEQVPAIYDQVLGEFYFRVPK